MDLSNIGILFSIIATTITGINFIFIFLGKAFWSLTFKKIEEKVQKLENDVKDHEKKNSIMRHDFTNVTNSIYNKMDNLEITLKNAIDSGYLHIKELFDNKITNLKEKIDEKR